MFHGFCFDAAAATIGAALTRAARFDLKKKKKKKLAVARTTAWAECIQKVRLQ